MQQLTDEHEGAFTNTLIRYIGIISPGCCFADPDSEVCGRAKCEALDHAAYSEPILVTAEPPVLSTPTPP